jgi:hypothetical protein
MVDEATAGVAGAHIRRGLAAHRIRKRKNRPPARTRCRCAAGRPGNGRCRRRSARSRLRSAAGRSCGTQFLLSLRPPLGERRERQLHGIFRSALPCQHHFYGRPIIDCDWFPNRTALRLH